MRMRGAAIMRDYGKISPKFWMSGTGKEVRRRGMEATIVAVYLMSSPHSNMLGLYFQPIMYMAYETGLGMEGASKGLQECMEAGFCKYDEESEMVWVLEMAKYQIASELKASDKRCAGIQKDYDALPDNPFLGEFFDRYEVPFNLKTRRQSEGAYQAPCKPHRSQEQEQEQEQDINNPLTPLPGGESPPPEKPKRERKPRTTLKTFVTACSDAGERPISDYRPLLDYVEASGLPMEFVQLAWEVFKSEFLPGGANENRLQADWRRHFLNYVKKGYYRLWFAKQGEGGAVEYALSTQGLQAQAAMDNRRRAA